MPHTNGTTADPGVGSPNALTDDEVVAVLRRRIQEEQARRADAEKLVAESRTQERRYQKALAALTGEPPMAPAPQKRHSRAKDAADWSISDQKVEEVYRRFVELRAQQPDQPITAGWLGDQTPGLSPESARRAFIVLRDRERIRLAGSTRGGGKAFELMPEPTHGS